MNNFHQAAQAIQNADAVLIAAGAGMGVDSGLPDFRGNEGFWKAYPPFAESGLSFAEVANPRWFESDPEMAWGFYGHRLNLYKGSTPHAGFTILKSWAQAKPDGYFIFTSNVDGHFQKAGFDAARVVECHGSIHHLQCASPCSDEIWDAADLEIEVDEATFQATSPLPSCPFCGGLARPNILMFSDGQWIWDRTQAQHNSFAAWQSSLNAKEFVVIECGAGKAIPSVRNESENLQQNGATLIRINPRESDGPKGTTSIDCGALEGLQGIDEVLQGA